MLTPSPRNHADHFNLLARFTSSSEAETVSPLSLTGRDVVSVFPTGTVTASLSPDGEAFSSAGVWSPSLDPPDLPMSDEENPSFGNNPNAEGLT